MLIGSEVYSIITCLLWENDLDANSDHWRLRSSHKKSRGIYWPSAQVGRGGGRRKLFFFLGDRSGII